MATTKEIRISQLPLEKDIRGMMTVGVNSANQSVKIPIGEVINEEIRKVKRTYSYSSIDALTVGSTADDVATALIAENESKRTMPNVGDILVDWGGVIRVPVVRQTVQTGGEKPIYSFSFRTADNTATKTVKIQGYLYEPQTVVSVETVKDVAQQQISSLDTQLAEEATARINQDDVLKSKITNETNARTNADKVLTDNLAKEVTDRTNAIKAEQTARVQADTAINADIQGIKDKGTLHDLFLRYGATYDQNKQKYILNGLELDFNQTLTSWVESSMIWNAQNYESICNSTRMLTNFRPVNLKNFTTPINMNNMFAYSAIEVVDLTLLNNYKSIAKLVDNMFLGNNTLRVLKGLDLGNVANFTKFISKCPKLEYVELDSINADLPISNSPLLKKESVLYLLQHAKPNKAITITLHPTAYAMATADPEIQAELEKQPNISLAEGEPSA